MHVQADVTFISEGKKKKIIKNLFDAGFEKLETSGAVTFLSKIFNLIHTKIQ